MSDFFSQTPIPDLYIYKPKVFKDLRGCFFESYSALHFKSQGILADFVQDNRSTSQKGTLRGLHMQVGAHAQAKLVSVLKGHVYDVAVDLRPSSPTFKKWFGLHLTEDDPTSLFIPRGFAHGFAVLSETAEFFYKVDNFYNKESERGIKYDDTELGVEWPLTQDQIILSDKDKSLSSFQDWLRTSAGTPSAPPSDSTSGKP